MIEAHARRTACGPPAEPFVIAALEGRAPCVAAANPAARRLGVRVGMNLEQARALAGPLAIAPWRPELDDAALVKLAVFSLRFSPLVAPCPPDGLWIDATGVAHLFGGEDALLARIAGDFSAINLSAVAAIADTPGAAWALARFGRVRCAAPGRAAAALMGLPLAALRLSSETVRAFRRLGVGSIGALAALPRATIPARFGRDVLLRLDQALGTAGETLTPILPPRARRRHMSFAEPIATPAGLGKAIELLCAKLCADMARAEEGARRLDVLFRRVDGAVPAIRIGTARPNRDAGHLAALLKARLESIDPGLGVDDVTLTAWATEPLTPAQLGLDGGDDGGRDLAALVDNLANRLGPRGVFKLTAVDSDMPERAARTVAPLSLESGAWSVHLPRPVRLFHRPEPIDVTAMLPDHPPAMFRWRGEVRKVRQADGPERVFGEWWVDPAETAEVRDYFRVEDDQGARYWLFRDGRLGPGNTCRWYLHGLFGA